MQPKIDRFSGVQDVAYDDEFGYTDLFEHASSDCPNGCNTWQQKSTVKVEKEIGLTIDATPEGYQPDL